MSRVIKLPRTASYPFPWALTFLFAGLAWIVTYQQLLAMHFLPMYGTMGLPLGPFLLFWTIMMMAMMLPALAPMVSIHYERIRQKSLSLLSKSAHLGMFLLGYLFIWGCVGLPFFLLGLLTNQLVLHAPWFGVGLGIAIFVSAGIYQLMPLKKRCLTQCNPSRCPNTCVTHEADAPSFSSNLKEGARHSIFCLGSCVNLMIVLIAVGLMNLSWMVLITLIIFVEKVWLHGHRLNPYIGMVLIAYGVLSFLEPSLLSGLYVR